MHKFSEEFKNFLLPYEVLRARFYIRDFFSRLIVKQIYENTGQILSLVRLRMSEGFAQESNLEAVASGKLIEQTIRELRIMGKCLLPDEILLPDQGLAEVLAFAVEKIFNNKQAQILVEEEIALDEPAQLILIKIILDALTSIKQKDGLLQQVLISQDSFVIFTISYLCEDSPLFENEEQDAPYLSIEQRLNILNGCFIKKITEAGHHQLILRVPKTKQL